MIMSGSNNLRNGKIGRNIIILIIINFAIYILSGFTFDFYFGIIEFFMKLLGERISKYLFKIFDQSLLPEQKLMKLLMELIEKTIKI